MQRKKRLTKKQLLGLCGGIVVAGACIAAIVVAFTSGKSEKQYPKFPDYQAAKYVDLGDYKNLKVKIPKTTEITEEMIQMQMDSLLPMTYSKERDLVAEQGKTVRIDFSGKVGEKKLENGTAKDYEVMIGSHKMIAGFEEQLVGMHPGDKKVLKISFPADYKDNALAGKTGVFHVQMKSIAISAERTEENIKTALHEKGKTEDDLYQYAKQQLEEKQKSESLAQFRTAILAKLNENSKVKEVPKELTDWFVNSSLVTNQYNADSMGVSMDEYIRLDEGLKAAGVENEKEFKEYLAKEAKTSLTNEVILQAIAEKEKLTVSDESYEKRLDAFAKTYGFSSGESFEKSYTEVSIRHQMLMEDVVQFLFEQNQVTEV